MQKPFSILLILLLLPAAIVRAEQAPAANDLREQVAATERAFAQTMAERDFEAFRSFLSDEAVFFSGEVALQGASAVAGAWESLFESPQAPFSWQPQTVEVLESGRLALSSGPVHDPSGLLTGTFTSIWRLEPSGEWKIVFDKGNKACPD